MTVDDITFDEVQPKRETGRWVKMRQHLGHWVLLEVEDVYERPNKFEAGETQSVAVCRFADLTDGTALELVSFSNPHIVDKLTVGARVVARVAEAESSRPGFARALVIEAPAGEEYEAMKQRARALLIGASAPGGQQPGLFD